MRFRSPWIPLSLIAALALTATACGSQAAGSGDGNAPVKIGAWAPLTGPVAASGVPQKTGAEVYFKKLNDEGGINGHKVQWVVKDNAFDPQQTVQVARQLVGEDKVVAIVSANGTAQAEAAFPFVLQQSRVPILNELGGATHWYDPARPLLFGVQTLYEDQAAAIAGWSVENGARKLLVIHSDPAAFVNVAKQVEPAAKKVDPGVTVERLSVKFQSTDYSPVVSEVRAKKPDAVVLILAAPEAAAYLKEAKLQGIKIPAYGYAPPASAATLTLAGDAAEGFHAVQLVKSPDDPSPAVKEFRDAMAKYAPGQPADFIALWGWMNAKVFAEIAKTIHGPITSKSIVAAYEKADHVDIGVAPVMSFSSGKHQGTRQVQRVTVQNGKWVSIGDFYTPPERT